jgi:hypothetical protein
MQRCGSSTKARPITYLRAETKLYHVAHHAHQQIQSKLWGQEGGFKKY